MRKALALVGVAAGAAVLFPTLPAAAGQNALYIKIDGSQTFTSNTDYSTVNLTFKVKCDPSMGSVGLYGFVSQPQAPNSFGFTTVTCTGSTNKVAVSVSSNFGTTYTAGPAIATVTNFANGVTRTVTLVPGAP